MLSSNATSQPQEYLTGLTISDYFARTRLLHPHLHAMIDADEMDPCRAQTLVGEMNTSSWEFEADDRSGRGVAYNLAQRNLQNRRVGMKRLLRLVTGGRTGTATRDMTILDALAGNGTLSRFSRTLPEAMPVIVSADLSKLMIDDCLSMGLPCIRQSATHSLLKDSVLDGLLIAYGSHHLHRSERRAACREAHRTLKPGARAVLHDFEIGGRMDAWFRHAVHTWSTTGHPHRHFTRGEMRDLLSAAGFRNVTVLEMKDPFTVAGATAHAARRNMLMHLYSMYDLRNLNLANPGNLNRLERRVERTLGPISVLPDGNASQATLMRTALVAVGTK